MIRVDNDRYIISKMTQLEVLRWKGIEARGIDKDDNNFYELSDIITACKPTGTDRDIWVDANSGMYTNEFKYNLKFQMNIDDKTIHGGTEWIRTSPDLPIITGYDPEIIKELAGWLK